MLFASKVEITLNMHFGVWTECVFVFWWKLQLFMFILPFCVIGMEEKIQKVQAIDPALKMVRLRWHLRRGGETPV
jgi:hypothetical protein